MHLWISGLFALVLSIPSTPSPALAAESRWEGLRVQIQSGTLRFESATGQPAATPLQLAPLKNAVFIGWLRPGAEATPFLILSADSPGSAEKSIYILSADGKGRPQRLTYPGRLLDPKTREVVMESRTFFGRCIPGQQHDAVVVYQRERLDRKHGLQNSLYIAEATPGLLTEKLLERRIPPIRQVQNRVRLRQCFEISGSHRLFNATFFDFRNKRGNEVPDVEDDRNDDKDEKDDDKDGDKPEEASQRWKDLLEPGRPTEQA